MKPRQPVPAPADACALRRPAGRSLAVAPAGLAVCLALASHPALAATPSIQISAGVDYSSGKYGSADATEAVIAPITGKLTVGNWIFRATVPFAAIKGPGDVSVLVDANRSEVVDNSVEEQNETVEDPNELTRRSGLSDISLSATHMFNRIGGSPLYLDTTGRIRLPTGDRARGLGAGATDYFLNAELGGDWTWGGLYAGLGRRFLGDPPRTVRRDGWQSSVGGWINAAPKTQIGAFYDWHMAASARSPDFQLVGAYVSYRATPTLRAQLYAGAGLSNSSPDVDVGVTFMLRPRGRER